MVTKDNLIYAYTRKQAIADGVLIDVTNTARDAGFVVPVAVTCGVWSEWVAVPSGVTGQDETGRLFSAEEAREWNGKISWQKINLLFSVERRSRRMGLLRVAVEREMSCRRLTAAAGAIGASHLPRGGRQRALPPTKGPARDVAEYFRLVKMLRDHNAVVFARPDQGTLDALWARRDTISPKLREQLEALERSAAELSAVMTSTATALRALLSALDEERPDDEIAVS